MNPAFLFTVEEAFQISGRGCVIVPRVGEKPDVATARVGDRIRLVKPDGGITDTRVFGVEMIKYTSVPREIGFPPILLPPALTKQDVPPGTRVYYLGRAEATGRQTSEGQS